MVSICTGATACEREFYKAEKSLRAEDRFREIDIRDVSKHGTTLFSR